jgi:hypothetical protein
MTTISLSLQTASVPVVAISFSKLYDLKEQWHAIFNELDNRLYQYLAETLDSINSDVLRQNKIRFKEYQRQKQGASSAEISESTTHHSTPKHSQSAWRTSAGASKPVSALSAQLSGADKVKLQLNRELNKLSPSNMDSIQESVVSTFIDFVINYITANGAQSIKEPAFSDKWQSYITELWNFMIIKLLAQTNYADTYFKFINRLITIPASGLTDKIASKLATCIEPGIIPKLVDQLYDRVTFTELDLKKKAIISEMIAFMKNSNYLASNSTILDELVGNVNADNCENMFGTLGKFVKYFSEVDNSSTSAKGARRMTRVERVAYDTLLLGLYDNFKYINELLQWEPINHNELEKRVYFTIGFFQDNKRFIQSLDMDFYRDMECQLDSLRRMDNIPTTIKYKLFDCIDNFIKARHNSPTI